nr:hypothetical protein [uncultured Devosia sp.]
MNTKLLLLPAALLACLATGPATAQEDRYDLVLTIVSETGNQAELPGFLADSSYFGCLAEKEKQVVPRPVPEGVLISPGGGSHAWTVISVECKRKARR